MNLPKTVVIGIDGVPFDFLIQQCDKKIMPNLADIIANHPHKKMKSVYPAISAVAWTSYMTGRNPAVHNIFGFIDRNPNPLELIINTGAMRKCETIFESLSKKGYRVISINVPMTYPPFPVNGIMVGCFMTPEISKVSYPEEFYRYLESRGYVIDPDARLFDESPDKFMHDIHRSLDARLAIGFDILEDRQWDFYQLHIMESDRLFHFFWDSATGNGQYSDACRLVFRKIDDFIGRVCSFIPKDARLLILSDHGFCKTRREVQLNTLLEKAGLLSFVSGKIKSLATMHPSTVCYSLIPGRIFLNLSGREQYGTVLQRDYDTVRHQIKDVLQNLKDPETADMAIDKIFFREEIYSGPFLHRAADIILHPKNGYDLKSHFDKDHVFMMSNISGMHTYDDAFICGINLPIEKVDEIKDVRAILES